MSKAILVVDVQRFFLHDAPSTLPVKIANEIKAESYETVAFTVFRNTADSNFVRSLNWQKCSNDEDVVLPSDFDQFVNDNNVFERNTYAAFSGTKLKDYLEQRSVTDLTICGVDTDACVLASAFAAFDLGYKVDVNFDLTFSGGELEDEAHAILKRSIIAK